MTSDPEGRGLRFDGALTEVMGKSFGTNGEVINRRGENKEEAGKERHGADGDWE